MRKTLIALALAFVAAPTAIVATATAADAAPRNQACMTKAEFRRIGEGDTISRVRSIAGTRGRLGSFNIFSDGDTWETREYRQCGKSWSRSAITVSFESTEYDEWISDPYCYSDYDYNGYYVGETCDDYGYYSTGYRNPLIVSSKSAYWF